MQKKLIALAIAGAFAAPAFAATSNVDVYGQVNVSMDFTDRDFSEVGGFDAQEDSVFRVSSTASRLGFKGTEDLGGGLSAVYQLELGFNADSTAAGFSARNAFAGLSSKSFGTIKIGRHDTPYKSSTGRLDVFGDTLGDYNALVGSFSGMVTATRSSNTTSAGAGTGAYNYGTIGNAAYDLRESDAIIYETPTFSGFSAAVMYGTRNESGAAAVGNETWNNTLTTVAMDPSMWSVSATYANGPLFITAAYEKQNETLISFGPSTNPNPPFVTSSQLMDSTAWKIGAAYTIGGLTAGLMYERVNREFTELDGDNDNSDAEHNTWYGSVAYKMGNITLKGAYARADDTCSGCNDGARQWTVGADYDFSKRTKIYALYTSLKADEDGLWTLGGNGTSGVALTGVVSGGTGEAYGGFDPSGFSLGVKHNF